MSLDALVLTLTQYRNVFLTYFIEVYLIYNVVLISIIQQSDSFIHILYIYIYIHIYIYIMLLFPIIFHDGGLSQGIEYSSMCYTV